MRYIRPAAIPRQLSPRLLRLTPQQRTPLRLPQVRLAQRRPATPPRTTQAVLQAHRDPLRLRTIRAVGLLTALQPRTTLVALRGQAGLRLLVTQLLTALVAEQADQRLQAGLLLTVRHVGHLAEQANRLLLVGRLATQRTGHLRPVSLHLEVTTPSRTTSLAITGISYREGQQVSNGLPQRFQAALLVRHTQAAVGLTTEAALKRAMVTALTIESTDKKLTAILVGHLAVLADRLLLVGLLAGLLTTTPHVERVSPQLLAGLRTTTPHVELLNQRQHRLTLRLRSALARLRVRLTRLRLEQVTVQRPRSTQRLRSVRHTEQATARLLRLIPTLRDLLVMQLAQADQRPQTATHQP